MKNLSLLLSLAIGLSASAAPQKFVLDESKVSKSDLAAVRENCMPGYTVDSKEDLAKAILRLEQPAENSGSPKLETKQIEESQLERSTAGFTGTVLTRVYLFRQPVAREMGYPAGIYHRLEIEQYGLGAKRMGFTISRELLNYRDSAELAEGSECNQLLQAGSLIRTHSSNKLSSLRLDGSGGSM